jgi:predicted N-acetyltransferase YhbS
LGGETVDAGRLEICYLNEHISFAETVSSWIYEEFIKDIRDDLNLEGITARIKTCGKDTLPVRLVAVLDGKCIGTVSIVQNDLKCRDYTPWLAALVVDKSYRGSGIGRRLVSFAKEKAAELGYSELYLRTEHAGDYYRKLGWQFVEKSFDDFNLEPEVFKITATKDESAD